MKRTKETYFREFPSEAGTNELSGCREFEGEDLSTHPLMQNMTPGRSSSRTSRSSGWTSKSRRSASARNKRNTKICCTTGRLKNSTA